MKKWLFAFFLVLSVQWARAQLKPFRFAFISDTHIGSPDGKAEEDLRRTVEDINKMTDISFVVITGDITELGTDDEIKRAKQILDGLKVKWYIIPGNHDSGWSESGGQTFINVFGDDKFSFEYEGIRFLGCASGPYLRMSDGHIPRGHINWLDGQLSTLQKGQPLIFLNHYPIDNSLDNWYEITDRLRKYNTWAILCGHGHANKAMNFEDIPGVMGRSNLRAKEEVGGYNLVDVKVDSMVFFVRKPGTEIKRQWTAVKIETRNYQQVSNARRPDYSVNKQLPSGTSVWKYLPGNNVISTPAIAGENIIVGDQGGLISFIKAGRKKPDWKFHAQGAIYSSPAIGGDRVVVASADGTIYCFDKRIRKIIWERKMGAAVLGSPLIHRDTVFIGGSDHSFYALSMPDGNTIWEYKGVNGPVVSTPILYYGMVIFGAWDTYLYAVNSNSGELKWKWTNGSTVRNYSPASCIPVVHDGVVYVVAPDRYISAIDALDGKTLWRNNDATVRESIGMSEDGKWVYGKTMQDTIVAYSTSREKQKAAWKMFCGFGYEHVPSMLIEKEGNLYFGTRNGVIYCIDPKQQKINWTYKIDNSMVNTVNVISSKKILASTMDGTVVLLEFK